MALPTNIVVVNWTLLPFELWDYVFRYHVVDEYDALNFARTCTVLWEVYKSNGVKEWAWRNRWTRRINILLQDQLEIGFIRWSDDKREGIWVVYKDYGEWLWMEEHYVNGKLHGSKREWYRNGRLF